MEIAYDCSCVDYPICAPGEINLPEQERQDWVSKVWGRDGLERIVDTIRATGSRRIHFRAHCAGPWWPTRIPDAGPAKVGRLVEPSFEDWNPVADAVEAAHQRGMKLIAWFDLSEGHAGYPTEWALNHPELCIVRSDGLRLDGPAGLVGSGGVPFDPDVHLTLRDLVDGGFMDEECERPDGAPIDPQLSLGYPKVVEYRVSLLRELLSFGVDGVFLTANSCVGYEEPVIRSFEEEHGIDPRKLPEDDRRWVEHQRWYFTSFMARISAVLRDHEAITGRKLELILEGQGTDAGSQEPEAGWSRVPAWGCLPDFIDLGALARESLIDAICLWTLREIDRMGPAVSGRLRVATRYRYMHDTFTRAAFETRVAEARKRGVTTFVVNEPRVPLLTCRWIYPGRPGALYEIASDLLRGRTQ